MKRKVLRIASAVVDDSIPANGCLYWARKTCDALNYAGFRTVIQAGSARFPMGVADDGVCDTHFSYEWSLSEVTFDKVFSGLLPEMHVWAAVPDHDVVVDVTCGMQQQVATSLGRPFDNPSLPKVFVGGREDCQSLGLSYVADVAAIQLALVIDRGLPFRARWLAQHFPTLSRRVTL